MSDMIERVALALLKFENMGSEFEVPEGLDKWPVIMNDRGKDYWRQKARAAIEAMREPTDAMCEAAEWHQQSEVNQYHAAIDAALNEKSPAAVRPPG